MRYNCDFRDDKKKLTTRSTRRNDNDNQYYRIRIRFFFFCNVHEFVYFFFFSTFSIVYTRTFLIARRYIIKRKFRIFFFLVPREYSRFSGDSESGGRGSEFEGDEKRALKFFFIIFFFPHKVRAHINTRRLGTRVNYTRTRNRLISPRLGELYDSSRHTDIV